MGIVTIGTLSMVPPEMMEKVMGKNGRDIWKKANGIDPTPVMKYSERKSLGSERTFEQDTTDVAGMKDLLTGMTEKLAYEMRCKQRLTSCVTVKIRYSNFDTHTLQRRISYTSFDHELIPVVKELFGRLYQRRMLIRLIGVKFSHLVQGVQQLDMFGDTPEKIKLYLAIDRMRRRFGENAVRRCVSQTMDHSP
jgi:DNA polymerase IV